MGVIKFITINFFGILIFLNTHHIIKNLKLLSFLKGHALHFIIIILFSIFRS